MKEIGLYIHVPFCDGKCPYCDFYSVRADESALDRYTLRMKDKILSCPQELLANTVYFGGGTPGLLGTQRLCTLLDCVRDRFGEADEITAEVNPRSSKALDFGKLKEHGLNRVSVGMQSANDDDLRLLGRRHSAADAAETVRDIRSGGIDNISLDLMLGISSQTTESLRRSIDYCAELGAAHVSAYMLKIEEGTPYHKIKDTLSLPDEDETCDLYEEAVSRLAHHGYKQYEISNFCKSGKESRHNLKYWRCEEYLGLGPTAHSFLDGRRFYYSRSDDIPIDDGEGGGSEEYIALALRLCEGLIFSEYEKRFGKPFPQKYIQNAKRLIPTGLVLITDKNISLTVKGFLCSNAVIAEILF